jgi:hypothetical protein
VLYDDASSIANGRFDTLTERDKIEKLPSGPARMPRRRAADLAS